MNKADVATHAVDTLVKAAPPITVTGLTVYGVALPDIVAVLTIVYLVLQIGYTVFKIRKGGKDE